MSGAEWPHEEREALLALAAEAVDVVHVIRVEPDLAVEYVSDGVTRLLGRTPAEHYDDPGLLGRIMDAGELAWVLDTAGEQPGAAFEAVIGWRDRDGKTVTLLHECVGRRRPDGSLVLLAVGREIAVPAEEHADDDVESRYRLLAEYGSEVIVRMSPDSVVEWVSPSVTVVTGWRPEQLVGHVLSEFVHGDDTDAYLLQAPPTPTGEPARYRGRFRTARGPYLWLEATVRPLADGSTAGPAGWVAALRDVTEEVAARNAMDDQRHRFAAMFAHHDAVMLLVDPMTGAIVEANEAACRFYGYDHDRLTRMRITQLNTLDPAEVRARMRAATVGHRNAFVFPHRLADGTVRQVEVHSSPIEDRDGILLFSIVRDVTDDIAARQTLTDLLGS